jgi:hypothetical protein
MPGELVPIGQRPTLVASFGGPGAAARFAAWRAQAAALLAGVPPEAVRVEYAGQGAARTIRVRVDEAYATPELRGPNEAGAGDGLPPAD